MVLARWVLQMLTDDQKCTQLDISGYLMSHYEDDPGNFIKREIVRKSQERGEEKLTRSVLLLQDNATAHTS